MELDLSVDLDVRDYVKCISYAIGASNIMPMQSILSKRKL